LKRGAKPRKRKGEVVHDEAKKKGRFKSWSQPRRGNGGEEVKGMVLALADDSWAKIGRWSKLIIKGALLAGRREMVAS